MAEPKYKLVRAGRIQSNHEDVGKLRLLRLQALRDIPEHGVKTGDFGGYISKKVNLSHEGSCWVGEDAQVSGQVEISDSAYIGGRATVTCNMTGSKILISGEAKITGHSRVMTYTNDKGEDPKMITEIKDRAEVSGEAFCRGVFEVSDNSKVYGNARVIEKVRISGDSEVYGSAQLNRECTIVDTIINGHAIVGTGEQLRNGKVDKTGIRGTVEIQTGNNPATYLPNDVVGSSVVTGQTFDTATPISAEAQEALSLLHEIKDNMASYETDIVKLIKYPAMVDKGIPETLAMTVALKKVERLSVRPASDEFREAVEMLEQKFLVAESNAIKMAATILSEDQLKRTQKAKDLLSIASDDASSETEKKVAFVQGFKQLEGVIAVPESAYDTFRINIGLKEIEA